MFLVLYLISPQVTGSVSSYKPFVVTWSTSWPVTTRSTNRENHEYHLALCYEVTFRWHTRSQTQQEVEVLHSQPYRLCIPCPVFLPATQVTDKKKNRQKEGCIVVRNCMSSACLDCRADRGVGFPPPRCMIQYIFGDDALNEPHNRSFPSSDFQANYGNAHLMDVMFLQHLLHTVV